MAAEETSSRAKRPGKRRSRLLIVLVGAVLVLVLSGILGSGTEQPPPGSAVNIKSFAKVYVMNPGTWVAMVDYTSGLSTMPELTQQADFVLGQLSGELDAIGVTTAAIRVVEVKRWFFVVSMSSPRASFKGRRGPNGFWQLEN